MYNILNQILYGSGHSTPAQQAEEQAVQVRIKREAEEREKEDEK